MLASILGPDMLIVLAAVLVLFGGTQIPKLARSFGSAKTEFQRGQDESKAAIVVPVDASAHPDNSTR